MKIKKKKFIAILSLCMLLTACSIIDYEAAEDKSEITAGGYFTLIKEWDCDGNNFQIVYANDSKVKYLIWYGGQKGGITPLYNKDGSLQIYKESE